MGEHTVDGVQEGFGAAERALIITVDAITGAA